MASTRKQVGDQRQRQLERAEDRRSVRKWLATLVIPLGLLLTIAMAFATLRYSLQTFAATTVEHPAGFTTIVTTTPASWPKTIALAALMATSAVAASLMAIPLAFLIASFLRKRKLLEIDLLSDLVERAVQPDVEFIDAVSEVPWKSIFQPGRRVDCIARFLDWPLDEYVTPDELSHFFRGGGSIRIALPDPSDSDVVNLIENQRPNSNPAPTQDADPNRAVVFDADKGLEVTLDLDEFRQGPSAKKRIGATIDALMSALHSADGEKSQCQIVTVGCAPNFFGLSVDHVDFYYAPYEHHFEERFRAPIVKTDLRLHRDLSEFWHNELSAIFPKRLGTDPDGAKTRQKGE